MQLLRTKETGKRKKRIKRKRKQAWYDNECLNKYRQLKSLSRQLANNSWDSQLRRRVFYEHKQYKHLVRRKHRLFRNKLLGNLIEKEIKRILKIFGIQ